jgi:hypothetical protein
MVAFSPVSGKMINTLGGRITLITGCAIMAVAYFGRVFLDHSLASIIIGSTVVSIGSAISYAAMPSLIMANVPITETASANGLNALLRALGTSTASAVIAALLTGLTITVGGETVTNPVAFAVTYALSAAVCVLACGVIWFVPRRVTAVVTAVGGPLPRAAAVNQAGENTEIVVRGRVLRPDDRPHPHAVVTAVRLGGEPVDWSRADNEGRFSLALPGRDCYLVIANADGWTPRSAVTDFGDPGSEPIVRIGGPLMLTGVIRNGGHLLDGAVLTLSATTGEVEATTATDPDGRYELRLPPPGHHILTVLDPSTRAVRSVKIFTTTQSAVADLELVDALS